MSKKLTINDEGFSCPALSTEELTGRDKKRFWSKVKKLPNDGCWEWSGGLRPDGYGQFSMRGKRRPHRLAYEMEVGRIPADLQLDHLCRNRRCVRPSHLEPVTPAENSRRGGGTKLLLDQVRSMRAAYAAGGVTQQALAARFGVSLGSVSKVLRRRRWRDV